MVINDVMCNPSIVLFWPLPICKKHCILNTFPRVPWKTSTGKSQGLKYRYEKHSTTYYLVTLFTLYLCESLSLEQKYCRTCTKASCGSSVEPGTCRLLLTVKKKKKKMQNLTWNLRIVCLFIVYLCVCWLIEIQVNTKLIEIQVNNKS